MSGENRCRGCGGALPKDALEGLCPLCLLRQGLDEDLSSAENTGSFANLTDGPITAGVLAALTETCGFGSVPQTLLRDTDPGPLALPGSPEMPAAGDRPGRLQLLGEIARGGMGAVLKGRDPAIGRDLAVKVLLESHRDKPELIRRFIEEAQIGGQLQHPGIVPIYELGAFADRRPYFAMKLVKGRTLSALLDERSDPARDLPRFLSIFEAVCQTMAYAHARGVIHRDLKPSNIMVGSFGEVQVMDWGLAKVLPQGGAADDASAGKTRDRDTVIATARSGSDTDSDLSRAGSVMGTPSYMAPEQARGEVDRLDERCDVFALGSILCELLTGDPAFTGRSSGEIQRKASRGDLKESADRLDCCGADRDLIALAKDCLAPELEDRPRHAGAITERITAHRTGVEERVRQAEIARAEEKARAEEATKRARVERDRLRLTVALAASVIGMIVLGVGGWAYLAQLRATRRAATERVVTLALDGATLLRGQAKAAPVGDLSKWSEARAAAKQARSLLAASEADVALHNRVDTLLADLEREQDDASHRAAEADRDRKLVDLLEQIRIERFEQGDKWKAAKTDTAYATAFREFGIDLDKLGPAEVGLRLKERSNSLELVRFLDDWAQVRRDALMDFAEGKPRNDSWRRIVAAAKEADPEPWRDALRGQIGQSDPEPVRRLADDDKTLAAQPARSLILLAQVLEAHYQSELAEEVLKRAWRLQPDDYWICSQLARTAERGKVNADQCSLERVRFASIAVALRPKSAWAHIALGDATLPTGGLDPMLQWSFEMQGTETGPMFLLDVAKLDRRKLDAAIDQYRLALRLEPDDAYLHRRLARALIHVNGAINEAITEYREAMLLQPNDNSIQTEFALNLVHRGRIEEAIPEIRHASRLNGTYHILLGHLLRKQGKKNEAFSEFHEAYLSESMHGSLQIVRDYLNDLGRPEDVIAVYRERIRSHPEDPFNPFSDLGFRSYLRGNVSKSISLQRDAVKLRPADADARNSLGYYMLDFGEAAMGLTEIREALRLKPNNPNYLDSLGWALLVCGDLKGALENLREASHLQKEYPGSEIQAHLRYVERLSALEKRLDVILRGQDGPSDAEGRLDVAELCRVKGRFAAATRFYREAFQAKPSLAGDLSLQHRLHAAIAAAQAGTDPKPAKDNPPLDEAERARWRAQALDWLRAEKDACAKIIGLEATGQANANRPPNDDAQKLPLARKALDILTHHSDLSYVREPEALARLPQGERKNWQALWAGAADLLKRAE